MHTINALTIWEEIAHKCQEARDYYTQKYSDRFPVENERKREILEQGAADFDQKYAPDDASEKLHYQTDYYVHGYMDMHIKQNLSALKHSFDGIVPQPLLFVDCGCGPMTSGLALAEILSEQTSDYKTQTSYFGIDASCNMIAKAHSINNQYDLFAPENFAVVQDTEFNPQQIPRSFPEPQTVVLWLSFVLAPETYKGDILKFADRWKIYVNNQLQCRETRIIYLNPKSTESFYLNNYWRCFRNIMLGPSNPGKFFYTATEFVQLPVESLSSEISFQTIHGTQK